MNTVQEPTDNRAAYAAGLRELADFIEANPDLPAPYSLTQHTYPVPGVHGQMGFAERDECERAAAKLGVTLEMNPGGQYRGEYQYGRINLTLVWFTPEAIDKVRAAAVPARPDVRIVEAVAR